MKLQLVVMLTLSVPCLINSLALSQDRNTSEDEDTVARFKGRADLLANSLIFSEEFTRVTDLKTSEGLPDYEAAINNHFGTGVSPDQNGAVALYQGLGPAPEGARLSDRFFNLLGMPVPPDDGPYFERFGARIPAADRAGLTERYTTSWQHPWAAEDFPELAQWLRDNEKAVDTIVRGTMRPKYYSPLVAPRNNDGTRGGLIGAILPGIQRSRDVGRYLVCRAMLNLEKGNVDRAWQDLMACHRLGEMIGRGPTLIEYLVGTAINGIATHGQIVFLDRVQPAASQLAQFRQDLATLRAVKPAIEQMVVTERMMYLDSVVQIACGRIDLSDLDVSPASGLEKLVAQLAMLSIDWNIVMREGNQIYDRFDAAMKLKTLPERKAAMQAIETELQKVRTTVATRGLLLATMTQRPPGETVGQMMGGILSSLLLPALSAVDQACNRSRQNRANLLLTYALADWKAQNDSFPENLRELVPEFVASQPVDLFNGKPLNYRRLNDGFILYSIGVNGKDDQGRTYGDTPPGDDLIIQLPLPQRTVN